MFDKFKKASIGVMLSMFILTSVFGSLFAVKPANATPMTNAVLDSVGATFFTKSIQEKISGDLEERIKVGVFQAVMRMTSYFIQKVSYDLAVYAASGGKGQGGLVFSKGFTGYMKDVGDHAIGSAIDELGKSLGLNLCKPPNLSMDLTLRLGLKAKYCDPETGQGGEGKGVCQPHCTLSDFKKNWSKVGGAGYWKDTAKQFNLAIEPSQTDMGIFLEANARIDKIEAKAKKGAEQERNEGDGAKGVTNLIAGDIKTPGKVIMQEQKEAAPGKKAAQAKSDMSASYSTGFAEMPAFAASVFLNTFLSTVLKGFMEDGVLFGICVTDKCKKAGSSDVSFASDPNAYVSSGGRRAAEAFYRKLLKVDLGFVDNFDLLTKFEICDQNTKGAHNCVIDSLFAQAVRRADLGDALTIAEAMSPEVNLLDPNKVLRGSQYYSQKTEKSETDCYREAYCYHNIKKLRQARILPLGFEIAAGTLLHADEVKLKTVVDGFHDKASPYYHLVDPEWILKIPKARCDTYAYGPDVQAGTSVRLQECVDLKSCVKERDDGECEEYGYCVMEKNVWKFDLDKCAPQNRTCQAFTTIEGEQVGYLTRTVDADYCDDTNSGCSKYSLLLDYTNSENPTWSDGSAGGLDMFRYAVNTKVDTCSESSAGCAAFRIASDVENNIESDPIYLRRAPYNVLASSDGDMFSCYNEVGEDYPQTKKEFNELEEYKNSVNITEECDKYAQLCIPEEEDCNLYSPVTYLGIDIPAKFKPAEINNNQIEWNDQCDQSCVGYAAYQELESNYSSGVSLSYIIPQSSESCSNPGCSAFTNLSTASGQTEDIEYYSYLRPCVKQNIKPQKTYITYEGGGIEGIQLKTYALVMEDKIGSINGGETGSIGSPKYFYRTPADLVLYDKVCNETTYWDNSSLTNPEEIELNYDCRQINDETGGVYYRLLSKTIAVSDECTAYRLNNTDLYVDESIANRTVCSSVGFWDDEENECNVCFQNGEYRDGFCYYEGLPKNAYHGAGLSDSCPQEEDTCRSYKGNAGNNIEEIFLDSFESSSTTEALVNWNVDDGTYSLSTESTQSNGHSLQYISSGNNNLIKTVEIENNQIYQMSFWAKGASGNLTVSFGGMDKTFAIGDDWRNYQIDYVKVSEGSFNQYISFNFNGKIFLDNVRLVRVEEHINIVKNKLNIPLVCDSNQYDEYPGEALGCSTYSYQSLGDTNKTHLINFSYLCREGAVGCTKLIDTYNTSESGSRAYNVWLESSVSSTVAKVTLGDDEYECDVPNSEEGCYIPLISNHSKTDINNHNDLTINASSVYVPAEDENDPIYLVANQEASCNSVDEGCIKVGKVNLTANKNVAEFEELYLKLNDPDLYADDLCKSRSVGCKRYISRDSSNFYFKDPKVLGGKVCEFKEKVDYVRVIGTDTKVDGWFWKETGKCFNGSIYEDYCTEDKNCSENQTCEKKGEWPCYEGEDDYITTGSGYFGLWSFGMNRYDGFVGECPVEEHSCTKFVDNNDQDKEALAMGIERGVAYYYLNNEKLDDRIAECEGMAGIKGGCVLLDKTDDPIKLYDTLATYEESKEQDAQLVEPITRNINNNPDFVLDANLIVKATQDRECAAWQYCSAPDEFGGCDMLGVCKKVDKSTITGCSDENGDVSTSWPLYDRELYYNNKDEDCSTESKGSFNYYCRDVNWYDPDYSGYTLAEPSTGRTYQIPDIHAREVLQISTGLSSDLSCRIYPTAESPYAKSIFPVDSDVLTPPYNAVNIFYKEFEEGQNDCGYKKITYGSGAKVIYIPIGGIAPSKMCVGGNEDGVSGSDKNGVSKEYCEEGGGVIYNKDKKTEKIEGELGYCVEYDESRPINNTNKTEGDTKFACLTWLPVNVGGFGLDKDGELNAHVMKNPYNPNPENERTDIDRYVCLNNDPLLRNMQYAGKGFGITGFDTTYQVKFENMKKFPASLPPPDFYYDIMVTPKCSVVDVSGDEVCKELFATMESPLDYDAHNDGKLVLIPKNTGDVDKTMPVYFQPAPLFVADGLTSRALQATITSGTTDFVLAASKFQLKYTPLIRNASIVAPLGADSEVVQEIYKDDIDRIDVYIDYADQFESHTPAWISLDKKAFEEDRDKEGDSLWEDVYYGGVIQYNTDYKYRFYRGESEILSNKYTWWSWMTGIDGDENSESDALDFKSLFCGGRNSGDIGCVSTEAKDYDKVVDTIRSAIFNDQHGYYGHYDTADDYDYDGMGFRIWFDETEKLKGFEYAIGSDDDSKSFNNSFVLLIYLNNGDCQRVAKIWDKDEGGKAYSGYLNKKVDRGGGEEDYLRSYAFRNKDIGYYSDYGLVIEGFDPSDSTDRKTKIGVDPSPKIILESLDKDSYNDYNNWWAGQKGGEDSKFKEYFKAGIPLSMYREFSDIIDDVWASNTIWGSESYIANMSKDNLNNYVPRSNAGSQRKSYTLYDVLLESMFAKVYSIWEWDKNNLIWKNQKNSGYDVTNPDILNYNKTAPQIVPGKFLDCDDGPVNYDISCGVVTTTLGNYVNGFSINGRFKRIQEEYDGYTYTNYYGDYVFEDTETVNLGFYIYDDANQSPIINLKIDYDFRDNILEKPANIKTHKYECDDNPDDAYSFDSTEGGFDNCIEDVLNQRLTYTCRIDYNKAVKEGFRNLNYDELRIEHINSAYIYQGPGVSSTYNLVQLEGVDNGTQPSWGVNEGKIQINNYLLDKLGVSSNSLVCVYSPRIQATDKWGWCNGECAYGMDISPDVNGCYDNDCNRDNPDAWTKESGRIFVKPPTAPTLSNGASSIINWDFLEDFVGSE